MNTLYLTTDNWDLTVDAAGNIAMAEAPYALAQDAASAIRTFKGEVYYDTTQGIPYFSEIFASPPPLELYRAQCVAAALSVPDVESAKVFFAGVTNRQLNGQVQISTALNETVAIGF